MKKILTLIIFTTFFLATPSFAALDLELTQGTDNAIPIAIVPFIEQTEMPGVIVNDLQNSGRFRILDTSNMQQPHTVTDVDYTYWNQQKVNNLVIGKVTLAGDKYNVSFQLFDVYGKAVLLDKQFVIDKKQTRQLAHHISDLIYQQLIGERGVFSTKIAYVLVQRSSAKSAKYSLMVADADGYGPKTLLLSPEPIMSPAWSPDGKNIAYVSFENRRAAIYIQNVLTGGRKILTQYSGINGAPAYSPDGTKIALVLTLTGYPKIYVYDLPSSKLNRITDGSSLDTEPSWSIDNKSLLFTSDSGGSPQIYQVYLDDKRIKRVTYHGSYNVRASFTSDGKNIVMLNRDGGRFNIAVQDASGRLNILANESINKSPSIAPNGSMVVYATIYNGRGVLSEVSTDGRVKLTLPAQEGDVQDPAWSPFLD